MKKFFQIILFIVEAIPLPVSIISWIGTLITVADGVGLTDWLNLFEVLEFVLGTAFFVFIGIYPITYIFAVIKTRENKGLCLWSFLPIAHVLIVASVFGLLYAFN